MTRRAGAPVVVLTAARGRHEKSRQREGRRLVVGVVYPFNCTLPTAPTVGRAEPRVIAHSTPVAAVDDGPPRRRRQEARCERPSS